MKCIVIDDEELPRVVLRQLIENIPDLQLEGTFNSPLQAIRFLNQNEDVQLIFLDVNMPGFSGFDFIQTLKTMPAVILVTADKEHAITAFEYENVVDYLLKPVQKERFQIAVQKALKLARKEKKLREVYQKESAENAENEQLYVQSEKRLIKIDIEDIKIIEAKGNFILIKTTNGNHITYSSLKKIESKLPQESFMRVHRSYLINFKKIVDIEDNSVLIGKEIVPISRRFKPQLMERLNRL
ncbi:MAG: LytTR family DNA-binding domain-containing protein [Christiangramia sp.]|nr:DNA-binding response regulator [Christiangramia sp.]